MRRDPADVAFEMVRASMRQESGQMIRLWLLARRKTAVAIVLADLAAGAMQGAASERTRPGEILNRIERAYRKKHPR